MTETVDLAHYSAALDEIYHLRVVLAREAVDLEEYLTYATLPKSLRTLAKIQVARMRAAARGDTDTSRAGLDSEQPKQFLRAAGAPETLTRGGWETR